MPREATEPTTRVHRLSRRSVLGVAGAATVLGAAGPVAAASGGSTGTSVGFGTPVQVNPDGRYGYEPSVTVDDFGTIYATAHKASLTNEGTQLSSYFWYSADGGDTWQAMPAPADVDQAMFALEGDVAVDDAGTVYYVDTFLEDNHLHTWTATADGPVYDASRPIMGTTGLDDRPWIRAVGDGVLYYLGNNGTTVTDTDLRSGRIWFYRSTDGGLTWSPGTAIPTGNYCSLAESKADDQTVYVASPAGTGAGATFDVFASDDRGRTWTRETAGSYDAGLSSPFPAWSGTDRAGTPYHVWIDDDRTDDTAAVLNVTRRDGSGGWATTEVTPFSGTFGKQWIGAGREGLVAVVFYGTHDVAPSSSTDWSVYALVSTDATASSPTWTLHRLADDPVATGASAPGDFFEVAVGPDDCIHVTFGREVEGGGTPSDPTATYRNDVYYVRGTLQ